MGGRLDAVIIGAGLGGLTAAARLLHEGLSVLVLEAEAHPGGTAYLYRRRGFLFPMGPLGFSSPQLVKDALNDAGITRELETRRVHYQLTAFGMRVPLSLPYREMITRLSELFPDEEAGISRFFGHMRNLSRLQERLAGEGASRTRRGEAVDAAAYLSGLIKDWRLRRILGGMGSREPYSDLALLSSMWSLLCERGIHYPLMGMHGLCDLLAGRLGWNPSQAHAEGSGGRCDPLPIRTAEKPATFASGGSPAGRLSLNTRVAGITVDRGKASGVLLEDGTRIEAGAVISNADFKTTFLHLLPREAVPEGLRRDVFSARLTPSNLQVCLGLDESRVDLSAYGEASRIIHRRQEGEGPPAGGPDWGAPEIDPRSLAGEEMEIALLSRDDPSLAPPGHSVMVIRTSAPHRHFARLRPRRGRRSRGYFAYKTALAGVLIEEASNIAPGLADAVVYMDVATPLTFEERGGRSEGAVAGWSWERKAGKGREEKELVRTPIAGLYMAGHQAFSLLALGGVPSAMLSGLKAAAYLLAGAGPVDEMRIPV
ncbi:MAG: NAD(P)/FAD-dependent oxidoreductase [Actinobacteria bacterium]|nr:NAD(P)/FAD-dependent oxidoreductase [Actinomycetota bacterium]MDI6831994.1 NAD(P)/FAD-dependent oxidoreductase [Actinomycetota bacterium]